MRTHHPSSVDLDLARDAVGLHWADVDKLMVQLAILDAVDNVIVAEHDMRVAADWIIDLGPGAGDASGKIVAAAPCA